MIQDRPVLGGNASSEIRMNVCGAHGPNNRETGILEEIFLENHYRNPQPNFSIWDSVLFGKAKFQENLDVYLNASVSRLTMNGNRVESVTAWQMTTETWWTIRARLFADCSGDGILAPLSGAEYRVGREARSEYNESIAPAESDGKTMGLSCLFQAREFNAPRPFIPPSWAYTFRSEADLNGREVHIRKTNYWWLEVGGDNDSIHDAELLRDELVRIAFGVWDYIKNRSPVMKEFENWDLDWQGFLPGKRESRRYIGDHVLTQHDIESGGHFDDVVAHGGWSMDDHFPAGFYHPEKGTTFHPAPSPYGVPYRTLYSRNVENLFCAGRDHSATHVAMSSTRVMATCSTMGQAVGTAAAIAVRKETGPRGVYEQHVDELQRTLMDDDAWLPFSRRPVSDLVREAHVAGGGEGHDLLRNGLDRPSEQSYNGWRAAVGESVVLRWDSPRPVHALRIVFDSDLNRKDVAGGSDFRARNMRFYYALDLPAWSVPPTLVRDMTIDVDNGNGDWIPLAKLEENYQRLVRVVVDTDKPVVGIRLTPTRTWGNTVAGVFSVDVY